ncbi:MAG: hypothetical protein PS018_12090 [bacterium]|nr:hypothetical protein [bacterium]
MPLKPPVMGDNRQLVRLKLRQGFRPGAQIGPSRFELGERLCEALLRLDGVARFEAYFLLALSDELAKLLRNCFSELIDFGFRMLPGRDMASSFVPPSCTEGATVPKGRR